MFGFTILLGKCLRIGFCIVHLETLSCIYIKSYSDIVTLMVILILTVRMLVLVIVILVVIVVVIVIMLF